MWRKYYSMIGMLLLLCLAHSPLNAGSQQTAYQANFSVEALAPFAKQVERYAVKKGARVFILARLGSPKSELPEGIGFTHAGWQSIQTSKLVKPKPFKATRYIIYIKIQWP